jgi:hypothetical protein
MKPKEKAIELYSKMLNWQPEADKYLERNVISITAKKCALIAVDLRLEGNFLFTSIEYEEDSLEYWQEVKHEIEKL